VVPVRAPRLLGQAGKPTYVGYMCRLRFVKLTGPLERVLRVFLADASARQYGYDLMKAAKLPSGTLYPMLGRLHDQGLVISEWEPQPDDASGRPPRKYYQLTGEGIRVARLELAQASIAGRPTTAGATRPARGGAR
jgi:PadR family transcriptional regulator PadR